MQDPRRKKFKIQTLNPKEVIDSEGGGQWGSRQRSQSDKSPIYHIHKETCKKSKRDKGIKSFNNETRQSGNCKEKSCRYEENDH